MYAVQTQVITYARLHSIISPNAGTMHITIFTTTPTGTTVTSVLVVMPMVVTVTVRVVVVAAWAVHMSTRVA